MWGLECMLGGVVQANSIVPFKKELDKYVKGKSPLSSQRLLQGE